MRFPYIVTSFEVLISTSTSSSLWFMKFQLSVDLDLINCGLVVNSSKSHDTSLSIFNLSETHQSVPSNANQVFCVDSIVFNVVMVDISFSRSSFNLALLLVAVEVFQECKG